MISRVNLGIPRMCLTTAVRRWCYASFTTCQCKTTHPFTCSDNFNHCWTIIHCIFLLGGSPMQVRWPPEWSDKRAGLHPALLSLDSWSVHISSAIVWIYPLGCRRLLEKASDSKGIVKIIPKDHLKSGLFFQKYLNIKLWSFLMDVFGLTDI